jgi:hypothetical protein
MAEKIKGIGGWLILPTLGFFLAGIIYLYELLTYLPYLADGASLIIFLLIAGGLFFVVYSLILEFQYKREFPKWAIFTLWYGFVEIIIISFITLDYTGVFGVLLGAVIWTAYFQKSKRVKNTFIK